MKRIMHNNSQSLVTGLFLVLFVPLVELNERDGLIGTCAVLRMFPSVHVHT